MIDLSSVPKSLQDVRVTVLGAARSGIGACRLLAQHKGARVFLSDSGECRLSEAVLSELKQLGVETEFGGHSARVTQSELVVISPGIPGTAPVVQKLEKLHIPLVSEIELGAWFSAEARIIAVTGSNGKTTTTTLLGEIFKRSDYDSYCGGNIGISFCDLLIEAGKSTAPRKVFILELSSFQLERIVHFRPYLSIMLNVTDDHMDRYDHDINKYMNAKLRIAENQGSDDFYIYNADDVRLLSKLPANCRPIPFGIYSSIKKPLEFREKAIYFDDGRKFIDQSALALPGEHNLYNMLAASTAALIMNVPALVITDVLHSFKSIEHRLEFVKTINRVDYYNDSKATNVDSVQYALKSFQKPVVVILGGKDKDSDFSILIEPLRKHAKAVILIGHAAGKIRSVLGDVIPLHDATTMQDAVELGQKLALPGDVVLLSPACASFDMFDNFEHRGRVFKEHVLSLEEKGSN